MLIIGVSGKMGCGKTTFCNHLKKCIKNNCEIFSFGDLVKKEASEIFDVDIDIFYNDKNRMLHVSPLIIVDDETIDVPNDGFLSARQLLQWWGTDIRRSQDDQYWHKLAEEKFKIFRKEGVKYLLIDDVRFPNELKLIERLHGRTVRLEPYTGYKYTEHSKHVSETSLDDDFFSCKYKPEYGYLQDYSNHFFYYLKKNFLV